MTKFLDFYATVNPENTQLIKLDYTKENKFEIRTGWIVDSISVNGVRGGGLGNG